MKLNKFLFLLLLANISLAQTVTAKLKKIPSKEFYKIIMPAEFRSASKEDFGDLRIFNNKHQEVPYLIQIDKQERMTQQFEAFKISSKLIYAKKSTSIIVENPMAEINEITLEIANSEVSKTYNLSGSNDNIQWFGLVNKAVLSELSNNYSTAVIKTVSFPLCSYKFLKIDFDDTKTLPINVLKIGTTKNEFTEGNFQEVKTKNSVTTQIPDEKKSLIKVTFNHSQDIDKVVFAISNPSFFNRKARIYTVENQTIKNKTKNIETEIAHFTLASNNKNDFNIDCSKQKEIFIEIDNQDNELLGISSIKFYQKPIYIFAQLNANEAYTIETGNPNLEKPAYDLIYFQNEIENARFTIGMTDIEYQSHAKNIEKSKSFWQQSWFMWLCIAIGGISILYFSVGLVKDIKE